MRFSPSIVSLGSVSGCRFLAGGVFLGLMAAGSVSGAIFKNGFVDHSICCASGGPLSFDGTAVRGGGHGTVGAEERMLASLRSPGAGGTRAFQPVSTGAAMSAGADSSVPPAAPSGPPKEVDGHLQLEFARLSDFKVEAPAYDPNVKPEEAMAAVDRQIPEAVKRFDGKRAQITGFMLPVKMEGQLVIQFLLMRDQMMCCYGVVPRINDWIVVTVAKPVRYTPDVPVSFRGKLSVKAMQEQGFITGIYLLEEAVPGKL
jgi:hypothetical protein